MLKSIKSHFEAQDIIPNTNMYWANKNMYYADRGAVVV